MAVVVAGLASDLAGQMPRTTSPLYVRYTLSLPPGSTAGRLGVGDADRDGDVDVIVPIASPRILVIGQNDGGTGLTAHTVSLPPSADGPSDCSDCYDAGGDSFRDDVAVACPDGDCVAQVDDCGSLTPTVTVHPLPSGLQKPVSVAADNNPDGTPTVAVACEGRVFSGGGGLAVRVGNGPFTALSTTRSKYTRVAVAPLTEDGNLDVAGLWSGGVDLWKGVPSGGTFVYSPVGTLSLSSVILSALELQDADGDGDRDVTVVENDLFANPPVVTVRLLSNTGTGTLGPSRFSSTSFPLSGRSYVSSWSWGDRCDCDIDSYRSFRSAYYSDPGFTSLRASARFEDGSFTGGFPDHEVSSSSCDDVVTLAWDLDGLDDTAFVDQATSTLEVHRAVAFPVDDEYGTGCGSSTLSSEGTLDLGDDWTLRVDTEQGRPTVLLLATSPTDATISPGCALRVGPSLLCTPVTFSSPSGVARFTIDVPDDVSILSQEVCAQAAVVKPGGAHAGVLDVTSARRGKVGDCQ